MEISDDIAYTELERGMMEWGVGEGMGDEDEDEDEDGVLKGGGGIRGLVE